jgi:hypothetical protein
LCKQKVKIYGFINRPETGQWFSPGTLVSSNNKTDPHDIAEILLKMALDIPFTPVEQALNY